MNNVPFSLAQATNGGRQCSQWIQSTAGTHGGHEFGPLSCLGGKGGLTERGWNKLLLVLIGCVHGQTNTKQYHEVIDIPLGYMIDGCLISDI